MPRQSALKILPSLERKPAVSCVDLDWAALPASLQELKETLGAGGALALCAALGGRTLYIPARMPEDHPLAQLLGPDAAGRLSRTFAGDRLSVPKIDAVERQMRRQDIIKRRSQGEPVNNLALDYNLTPRRVLQILAEENGKPSIRDVRAA